jgi:hypothetical protein
MLPRAAITVVVIVAGFLVGRYAPWPRSEPAVERVPVSAPSDSAGPTPVAPAPLSPEDLISVWQDDGASGGAGREGRILAALAASLDASGSAAFDECSTLTRDPALPWDLANWLRDQGEPFLLNQIAQIDLDAALAIARRRADPDLDRAIAPVLLEAPPETLHSVLREKRFAASPSGWYRAGQLLAQLGVGSDAATTLRGAIDSSGAVPSSSDSTNRLVAGFVSAVAGRSYDDAVAFIGSLPGGERIAEQARQSVVAALYDVDPERAKSEAAGQGDADLLGVVAERMAQEDLPAALAWLGEASSTDPERGHAALLHLAPHLNQLPIADARESSTASLLGMRRGIRIWPAATRSPRLRCPTSSQKARARSGTLPRNSSRLRIRPAATIS